MYSFNVLMQTDEKRQGVKKAVAPCRVKINP